MFLPAKRGDDCLRDIKAQMAQNCVNFKGTGLTYDAPLKAPDPLLPSFKPTVSNLEVKLDREFKLDAHRLTPVKTTFYLLRVLSKI